MDNVPEKLVGLIRSRTEKLGWTLTGKSNSLQSESGCTKDQIRRMTVVPKDDTESKPEALYANVCRVVYRINVEIDRRAPHLTKIDLFEFYDENGKPRRLTEPTPALTEPQPTIISSKPPVSKLKPPHFPRPFNPRPRSNCSIKQLRGSAFSPLKILSSVLVALGAAVTAYQISRILGIAGDDGPDRPWLQLTQATGCGIVHLLIEYALIIAICRETLRAIQSRRLGFDLILKLRAELKSLLVLILWIIAHFSIIGYFFGITAAALLMKVTPEAGTANNALVTFVHTFFMVFFYYGFLHLCIFLQSVRRSPTQQPPRGPAPVGVAFAIRRKLAFLRWIVSPMTTLAR